MNSSNSTTQSFNTLQVGALIIGAIGVVLAVVGYLSDASQFFHSYIFGFLFWVELSIGCLLLFLIHTLVNGRWGFSIRRFLAAGSRTIALMAVLFVPVLLGLGSIYKWVEEPVTAGGAITWLTPSAFTIRGVVILALWVVLAFLVTQWSYNMDDGGDWAQIKRIKALAAGGLILMMLTTFVTAVDWNMSLTSDWFSSIFGWLSNARQILMAFALGIVMLSFFWDREPLKRIANKRATNDLAVLLLTGVMVLGYMHFMQYIIMWSANLVAKVFWWELHLAGTWSTVVYIFVGASALLLLVLILPGLKKNRPVMVAAAVGVLLVRFVEYYWLVGPSFNSTVTFHWLDVVVPIAIGGLWFAAFAFFLGQQSIAPVDHPELNRVMSEHHEGAASPVVS